MAAIREILTLEDRFTSAFSQYIRLSESASASTSDAQKAAQRLTQESKILASAYNTAAAKSKAEKAAIEQATAAQKKAEQQARATGNATKKMGSSFQSAQNSAGKLTSSLKTLAAGYLSIQGAQSVLNLSDQMSNTTARLNMIVDDKGSVELLEKKIMASANRSRASYLTTADSIAKMGVMARSAFANNDELITFTEAINKQFVIAGTSAEGIDAAMLQLTQAMSSGVLRGEELNSVFEQAPNIIQTIADYLDVPIGQIRDMASEGQITANIVKNAMLSLSGEIDEQFQNMPKTWNQVWTLLQNSALEAFQPILDKIGELANSGELEKFTEAATKGMKILANAIGWVIDNLDWLAPVVMGVVAAYGALKTAQILLNIAMYANPVGIIIALFVLFIAVIIALWDNCEGFRNFFIDMWQRSAKAYGEFYNNVFVPVGNGIFNTWATIQDATKDFAISMVNFIANMAKGIIENFNFLTKGAEGVIKAINAISSHFGGPTIDYDATVNSANIDRAKDYYLGMIEEAYTKHGANGKRDPFKEIDLTKYNQIIDNWAEKAEEFRVSDWLAGVANETNEVIEKVTGAGSGVGSANQNTISGDEILDGLSRIADNTDALKKEVSMAEEDIKMLVDMAEREYVANVNLTAQSPVITVNATSNDGSAIQPKAIANAIKNILIDESSSHTVRTYSMI